MDVQQSECIFMYPRRLQNNGRGHDKSLDYKINTHGSSIATFHRYMLKGKGFIHKYTDGITDLDTPITNGEE